ncbi:MAG: apolipoprotein N-acyltransferase [Flavobacteriaceae bacterium]|nr:apolipoprotein N-acyltransferase [Flavobacteriaceae bacterium]
MKKILLALFSGLLLALSWPTYGFAGFIFFAFVPLFLVEYFSKLEINKRRGIKVFGLAYLSFFLWNLITTHWLYYSDAFGMAFAVLVNSLLMAFVFWVYHQISKRVQFTASASFFVAIWLAFEELHLHWDFSWPWLNLGNVFANHTSWIQWYEYTGTFGGSLWVLLVNLMLFKGIILYLQHKDKSILARTGVRFIVLVGLPILLSIFIQNRLGEASGEIEILAVQPNIDPYSEKYHTNDAQIAEIINTLIEDELTSSTEVLLLPETVFANGTRLEQYNISHAHQFSNQLLAQFPKLSILGGISAYDLVNDEAKIHSQTNLHPNGFWYNDYNASFFEKLGSEPAFYLKSKLVVGVENFPFKSVLEPILGNVMLDLGGTVAMKTTQEERSVFTTQSDVKLAPIICYESVYGEFVTGYVKNGASILSIMTNDAWWDETQGHQQHWAYAKLRAIETRRAVARSANTGISGFIDQDGRVISKTNYDEPASIQAVVPIYNQTTFYVTHGDYIPRITKFLLIFIFLFAVIKHKREGIKR